MRIVATALAITTGAVTLAACQPLPQTCEAAIGLAFIEKPPAVRTRMQRVSWRESRNTPTARNGQFYGCVQIGTRVHAARIRRFGYSAADMLRAWPNAVIARALFNESGVVTVGGYRMTTRELFNLATRHNDGFPDWICPGCEQDITGWRNHRYHLLGEPTHDQLIHRKWRGTTAPWPFVDTPGGGANTCPWDRDYLTARSFRRRIIAEGIT